MTQDIDPHLIPSGHFVFLLLTVNEEAARSAREVPAEGELLQAG